MLRELSRTYSLDDDQAANLIALHALVIEQGRSANGLAAVETVKRLLGGVLIPHFHLKEGLLAQIKALFVQQVELQAGLDHYHMMVEEEGEELGLESDLVNDLALVTSEIEAVREEAFAYAAAKGKETAAKGGSTTQSGQATGAFELTSSDAEEVVRLMVAGGVVSRVGNDLTWSELKLPENAATRRAVAHQMMPNETVAEAEAATAESDWKIIDRVRQGKGFSKLLSEAKADAVQGPEWEEAREAKEAARKSVDAERSKAARAKKKAAKEANN